MSVHFFNFASFFSVNQFQSISNKYNNGIAEFIGIYKPRFPFICAMEHRFGSKDAGNVSFNRTTTFQEKG